MREACLALAELVGVARPEWEVRAEVGRISGVIVGYNKVLPDRVMVWEGRWWVGIVCGDYVAFEVSCEIRDALDWWGWAPVFEWSDPGLLEGVLGVLDGVFSRLR